VWEIGQWWSRRYDYGCILFSFGVVINCINSNVGCRYSKVHIYDIPIELHGR
jgi:hypothetical protein